MHASTRQINNKARHLSGWKRDRPDHRDMMFSIPIVAGTPLPKSADNSAKCSPIEDQGDIGSCFPAGTPILLANRCERPIEEIGIGNKIITHTGIPRRVTKIMRRDYSGKLFTIKIQGWGYPLSMTEEHPVAVIPNVSPRAIHGDFSPGKLTWTKAKDLQPGDFVIMTSGKEANIAETIRITNFISGEIVEVDGMIRLEDAPILHSIPDQIPLNSQFARLIGLFLAEGSYRKSAEGRVCGIQFTFARHEKEYQNFTKQAIEAIFGTDAKILESDRRPSVSDVRCENSTLARFIHTLCGEGALHKSVSSIFFQAPEEIRLWLLRGWLQGDGSQNPVRVNKMSTGETRAAIQVDGVTSSESLHRDMFRLAMLCGLKPSASIRKIQSHQNANPRALTFYSNDVISLFPEAKKLSEDRDIAPTGRTWYKRLGDDFLCKIRSIETELVENLPVFNLEVDEDHTYVANSIVVHNCTANSSTSAMEYLLIKIGRPLVELSRLFVYYYSRKIEGTPPTIDSGAYIRDVMKCLAYFGAAQEKLWPYDAAKFSIGPSYPAIKDARLHRVTRYFRCVGLDSIKRTIADGYTAVGGFSVPENMMSDACAKTGIIQFPAANEQIVGAHAVHFVGFDDNTQLLKIQNSWGTGWGTKGFGFLPYDFVKKNLAEDFWTIRAET